jgi:hypothetical protein
MRPTTLAISLFALCLHSTSFAADNSPDNTPNNSNATMQAEMSALKQRLAALEEAMQRSAKTAPAPTVVVSIPTPVIPTSSSKPMFSMDGSNTTFSYKGYVKVDALASRFSAGEVASSSAARDFYVPSATPVGNGESSQVLDAHAKQTRIAFASKTSLDNGKSINTQVEMDFMVALDGNERATNGYEPELRHAFIQYDKYLIGQTWSNFMDVNALTDSVDFIGPTEGSVFVRQPQFRYSQGAWAVSVENPETTLSTAATTTTGVTSTVSGDGRLPDLTARYTHSMGQQGHLSAALLLRELRNDNNGTNSDHSTGAGVSVSGRYNLDAANNLRGAVTYGQGIGRYVGVNLVNDAALDANGQLHNIDVTAGFLAYQHQWRPDLRSSVGLSYFNADIPTEIVGTGLTKTSQSALVNVIYTIAPALEVGAELLHGQRELSSGLDGSVDRLQLSAKYRF